MSAPDSGIHLGFDVVELDEGELEALLREGGDGNGFYTLKSKPPVACSPPPSVKALPSTSRTQLKQQLMRQQLQQQQEAKDRDAAARAHHTRQGVQHQTHVQQQQHQQQHQQQQQQQQPQQQQAIAIPTSSSPDVPPQVLQVQTRLENPTYYHVLQAQRRQMEQYLSGSTPPPSSGTRGAPPPAWPHSDPGAAQPTPPRYATGTGASGGVAMSAPRALGGGARGPVSPAPPPSTAPPSVASLSDASEVEDVIDEILSLEEGFEAETRKTPEQLCGVQQAQPNNSVPDPLCNILGLSSYMGKTSTSCPPDVPQVKAEPPVTDQQLVAYMKDRQKKDNHNMIERRRRFNINDRIKELATLLPKSNEPYFELVRDLRHNKGQILKASVDYIRRLKLDADANKEAEAKRRALEQQNRQLHLRIQELEGRLRTNGIKVDETNIDKSLLLSTIIKSEVVGGNMGGIGGGGGAGESGGGNGGGELKEVRCSPSLTGSLLDELLEDFTSGGFNLDLMDDDGPAFTSDPVFSSPQVSSPNSSHHSFDDALTPDSMDITA